MGVEQRVATRRQRRNAHRSFPIFFPNFGFIFLGRATVRRIVLSIVGTSLLPLLLRPPPPPSPLINPEICKMAADRGGGGRVAKCV